MIKKSSRILVFALFSTAVSLCLGSCAHRIYDLRGYVPPDQDGEVLPPAKPEQAPKPAKTPDFISRLLRDMDLSAPPPEKKLPPPKKPDYDPLDGS